MKQPLLLLTAFFFLISCSENPTSEKLKQEIIETEAEFARVVKDQGIAAGFIAFADNNAVLKRGDSLISGKQNIVKYYSAQPSQKNIELAWKPDFVEVSASGDMAYTYGKYIFSQLDSTGEKKSNTGIFHTVWKRQEDGSWKYVWD